MPKINGRIPEGGAGAFVQLRDAEGDFVGEVRADEQGEFTFYAVPGDWHVICLMPGGRRLERDVSIEFGDVVIKVPA